jgi:hypothetical protein
MAADCFSETCVPIGPVTVQPYAAADFDQDCDLDADDLATFIGCVSGPAITHSDTPTCQAPDFDHGNDVSHAESGVFQRCLSGGNQQASSACRS